MDTSKASWSHYFRHRRQSKDGDLLDGHPGYKADAWLCDLGPKGIGLGALCGMRSLDCVVTRWGVGVGSDLPSGMCGSLGISPGALRSGQPPGWVQARSCVAQRPSHRVWAPLPCQSAGRGP